MGRLQVVTLMNKMGIEALYRRPNTSKSAPGHKVYSYLLRNQTITRPNQVWAMDITYVSMSRGFVYLAIVVGWSAATSWHASCRFHRLRTSASRRWKWPSPIADGRRY